MRKIILSAFLFFITVTVFSQDTKQENNSPAPALMNKTNNPDNGQTKSNQNTDAPALMHTKTGTTPAENSSATKTAEPKLATSETNGNSSQPKNKKKNIDTGSNPK